MTRLRLVLAALVVVALAAAGTPWWLPLPGTLLVATDAAAAADAALLLDGSGPDAIDGVERWRQAGLVRDVVIVETPVKTHALVAYWSDFVAWGLARGSPTPAAHLRVARADSPLPIDQMRAAQAPLSALGAHSVLLPGGGLGSRLIQRDAAATLGAAGIAVRLVPLGPQARDPARWYGDADDRRAVLDEWVALLTAR